MLDFTTSVGLDVHARSIKAVAFNVATGEVSAASFGYDACAVAEWVGSLEQPAKAVYESGVTGFDLAKKLDGLGVRCIVGAVSKMIKPAADRRRKTDRKDAEFLARMLAVGNVSPVWVPDDGCEAARDLSRALEDARDELVRSKQLLSKFLLRHGHVFDRRNPTGTRVKNWTRAHWEWMRAIRFEEKADADVMLYYMDRVERAQQEKKRLEALVSSESEKPRWKPRVDALRTLKGIEVATAFALACEAGDFSRFKSARSFASWLGLVPSQRSSGEKDANGPITKAGNRHLRRLLVEAAWHYLGASKHAKEKGRGQVVDDEVRRHALKGVRRLVDRRGAMVDRGMNASKANVATARELAGWAWAIGRMVEEAA